MSRREEGFISETDLKANFTGTFHSKRDLHSFCTFSSNIDGAAVPMLDWFHWSGIPWQIIRTSADLDQSSLVPIQFWNLSGTLSACLIASIVWS